MPDATHQGKQIEGGLSAEKCWKMGGKWVAYPVMPALGCRNGLRIGFADPIIIAPHSSEQGGVRLRLMLTSLDMHCCLLTV